MRASLLLLLALGSAVGAAPGAVASCVETGSDAQPAASATVCDASAEASLFVPTDTDFDCLHGHQADARLSQAEAIAHDEYVMKCGAFDNTRTVLLHDLETVQAGARDSDGDGTMDAPFMHACVFRYPLVALATACHDTRTGESFVLVQAIAPTGASLEGEHPCVGVGIVSVSAAGTAPPEADASAYGVQWCIDRESGTIYSVGGPTTYVTAGLRDADGDGDGDEPYVGGELLP